MIDASYELQKAVYATLRDDPGLKAELGDPPRVYDDPPRNAVYPYVTLGETRLRALAGLDGGFEHEIRLNVFSNYAGRREVKRILGAAYDALHDAAPAISDHHLISLRFVFSDVFRRQDGETYSAVARFRAVTQAMETA